MSPTWHSEDLPAQARLGATGILRALLRGLPLALVLSIGLALLLLLRLIERPLFRAHRPWTPWITVIVCRIALRLIGLPLKIEGAPLKTPGVIVANHSSWLDIFTLNAGGPLYFVSKSEVANWPGIGWLARATGTLFVTRDRAQADLQRQVFEERLSAGHHLLFFPEGTSSDGRRVLNFKPTLFAALFSPDLPGLLVQPVTMIYEAPEGADPRHYGWWGDMEFGSHLVAMLASPRHGQARVVWHEPIKVADVENRKALAAKAEARVRQAHPNG